MIHTRNAFRTLRPSALLYATLVLPFLTQAQEDSSDTWFEQQVAGENPAAKEDGEKETSGAKLPKASPASVFNALMKEYERASEANLTKRIELLSRATKALPDKSSEAAAALETLLQQKGDILSQLDRAASIEPIELAIASLAPYRRYFNLDLDLSRTLLESPFAARVENAVTEAASRNDFASMKSLMDAVEAARISALSRSRIESLTKDSERAAIIRKWRAALGEQAPLKGESFLVNRILQVEEAKLGISIQIVSSSDERLTKQLTGALTRLIGGRFAPSNPSQADVLVDIDLDDISMSETITETTKSSVVPGIVDEQANPEFIELVAKYEKATKTYEAALKSYEIQFENWINSRQEVGSDIAQMKRNAENAMQQVQVATASAAPGSSAPGAAMAEFQAAQAELRAAESLERLSAPQNLPEPVKPTPIHLDILEKVYATPSTIIVSKEETPYDYTSQKIDATFNCAGSIAIVDATVPQIANGQSVALSRERAYIRNLDVNPRDPIADAGNYSPEAVDSAMDLFLLEFASTCAKKLDALFAEASERYLSVGLERQDPQAVVLALSLKASDARFRIPEDEARNLIDLAQNDAVTPKQLRNECLASVARVALASTPEKRTQAIALLKL